MNMSNGFNYNMADAIDTPITDIGSFVLTPAFLIGVAVIIVIAESIPLVIMMSSNINWADREAFRDRKMSRFRSAVKYGKTMKPYWSSDGRFDNASMGARKTILGKMKTRTDLGVYFNNEWRWLPTEDLPIRWNSGGDSVSVIEDVLDTAGSIDPSVIIERWADRSDGVSLTHVTYDDADVMIVMIGRTVVPVIIGDVGVDMTRLEIELSEIVSRSETRILVDSPVFIVNDEYRYAEHSKSVKSGVAVGIKTALCNMETLRRERLSTDLGRERGGRPDESELPGLKAGMDKIYGSVAEFIISSVGLIK